MNPRADRKIIVFDGVCNLCNGLIQFIIKRDSRARFSFCALQSEIGKELMEDVKEAFDSVAYFKGQKAYFKSTAVLNIIMDMEGLWKLFGVFYIVPKGLRDWIYDLVARNRYRWFGRRAECMIPTPDLKRRFLD